MNWTFVFEVTIGVTLGSLPGLAVALYGVDWLLGHYFGAIGFCHGCHGIRVCDMQQGSPHQVVPG